MNRISPFSPISYWIIRNMRRSITTTGPEWSPTLGPICISKRGGCIAGTWCKSVGKGQKNKMVQVALPRAQSSQQAAIAPQAGRAKQRLYSGVHSCGLLWLLLRLGLNPASGPVPALALHSFCGSATNTLLPWGCCAGACAAHHALPLPQRLPEPEVDGLPSIVPLVVRWKPGLSWQGSLENTVLQFPVSCRSEEGTEWQDRA